MHQPLSSANNRTPMQLWIRGLHDARGSGRAEDIENQVLYQLQVHTLRFMKFSHIENLSFIRVYNKSFKLT